MELLKVQKVSRREWTSLNQDCSVVPSEEYRYQSVCQQLSHLSQQNSDETMKKWPSTKLTTDDGQVCQNSQM